MAREREKKKKRLWGQRLRLETGPFSIDFVSTASVKSAGVGVHMLLPAFLTFLAGEAGEIETENDPDFTSSSHLHTGAEEMPNTE